jgi:Flp pilus assembly protein TadD
MATVTQDSKICPACGARNKAKWEFCVRCGESLEDVTVVMQAPGAAAEAPAVEEAEPLQPAGAGPGIFAWVGLVLVVGIAFAFLRSQEGRTDPRLFVAPTVERVPNVVTEPVPPGNTDLDEGRRLLYSGDPSALGRLAQAVANAPNDPDAHHDYAQALWQAGQQAEALTEYGEAARLAPPVRFNYRSEYAKALAAAGRTADAIREYEAILADHPDTAGPLRDLANLNLQAGNTQRAAELLRRAAELTPGRAVVQEDLGHALEKAGATTEAIAAYRRAIELQPESDSSRNLLADLLFRQNQKDEAIALVREGIQRAPDSAPLQRGLGSLLERAGDVAGAAAAYREYVRLAPNAPDAKQLSDRAAQLDKGSAPPPPSEG